MYMYIYTQPHAPTTIGYFQLNLQASCTNLVIWELEKPTVGYHLVMTSIAIENGQFIWDLPIKLVIFHGCISLP